MRNGKRKMREVRIQPDPGGSRAISRSGEADVRKRVGRSVAVPAAVIAILSAAPVHAVVQAPGVAETRWEPPRTPAGTPDIQGIWTVRGEAGNHGGAQWSLEGSTPRLNLITGQMTQARASKIVDPPDGKIPYQPWAAEQAREHFVNHTYPTKPEYIDGRTRCYPSGVPRQVYSGGGGIQIVQTPEYVVMVNEWAHLYRIIPTDGRPHVGRDISLWMGDSRGHWEGHTLVVDVTNSNDRTWFDQVGNIHSDALHVVERFTFVDANTIDYRATLEDPKAYTRPWTIAFTMERITEPGYELLEMACHEGERTTERLLIVWPFRGGVHADGEVNRRGEAQRPRVVGRGWSLAGHQSTSFRLPRGDGQPSRIARVVCLPGPPCPFSPRRPHTAPPSTRSLRGDNRREAPVGCSTSSRKASKPDGSPHPLLRVADRC